MAIEVLFVGTSSAAPEPGEDTACYLVNGAVLVDAGWNAALSMQRFGADPAAITHALFTHCHQDHTLGLPGLLFACRPGARRPPGTLHLYGPRDLPAVCAGACALLQAERYPDCVPAHEVTILHPGDRVRIGALEVQVGRAFHPLDARCYRLVDTQTQGSVVFGGDTAYHAGLTPFAAGCDVLVHEAAAPAEAEVPDLQRYLHSRPQDAAEVARAAGAGELVLVHLTASQARTALSRAQQTFPRTRTVQAGDRLTVRGPGQVEWE
ncbi:MAG: MBL fold metallo-hydrolase [Candidatus Latescibacterota bacterium]